MKNPDQIYASRDLLAFLWTELVKHLPASIALVIILSLANPGTLSVEASSRSATQIEQMPGDTGESGIEIGSSSEIYPLPPGTEVAEIEVAGPNVLAVRTVTGELFVLHVNSSGAEVLDKLFSSGVEDVSVSTDGKVAFSLRWENLGEQGIVIWSPENQRAAFHKISIEATIGSVKLVQGGLVVYELTQDGFTSLHYAFLSNGHISSGPISRSMLPEQLTNVSMRHDLAAFGSLINSPEGSPMGAFITWSRDKFQHATYESSLLFKPVAVVSPELYQVLSAPSGLYGAIVDGDTVRIKQVNTETLETLELPSIYLNGFKPTKLYFNEVPASAIPGQTGENLLVVSAINGEGKLEQWVLLGVKTDKPIWQLLPKLDALSGVNALTVDDGKIVTASVVDGAVVVEVTSPEPEMAFFPILTYPPDRQDLEPEVSQ